MRTPMVVAVPLGLLAVLTQVWSAENTGPALKPRNPERVPEEPGGALSQTRPVLAIDAGTGLSVAGECQPKAVLATRRRSLGCRPGDSRIYSVWLLPVTVFPRTIEPAGTGHRQSDKGCSP